MKQTNCRIKKHSATERILSNVCGYSLVEIALVVCILSLLLIIAIPSLSSWYPNVNFSDASMNMLADLHYAKVTAMKRNSPVTVSFDTAGSSCSALLSGTFPESGAGGSYTITVDDAGGGETTLKTVSMPNHVALCESTFTSDLVFGQGGLPELTTTSTISLINDESRESTLSVNLTGNISMD